MGEVCLLRGPVTLPVKIREGDRKSPSSPCLFLGSQGGCPSFISNLVLSRKVQQFPSSSCMLIVRMLIVRMLTTLTSTRTVNL
jgi:hypothetical protein